MDQGSATIYDTRAYAYMLAVYPHSCPKNQLGLTNFIHPI